MEEFAPKLAPDDRSCIEQNIEEWLKENPLDEKAEHVSMCMFNCQLKVFVVGGPFSRKDFHMEESEELFYQISGDMNLKVFENEKLVEITIKEGEIFLLPARIEHSPQRFENTIGLVIERGRKPHEMDCLRYFVEDIDERRVLWERWFHLDNVVADADLPPMIKEFFESDEYKSGQPNLDSRAAPPFEPNSGLELPRPINLDEYITDHLDEINLSSVLLYGPPAYKCEVLLYGKGKHEINSGDGQLILMPQRGEIYLECMRKSHRMVPSHIARILGYTDFSLDIPDGAVCLLIQMAT